MATQFIERMAVETDGDGETVLMIHGLGGTSNVWTPVLSALARHRTVRPDLPGSGRSHRVEGPLSIERFVQAMERVCAALGLARVHVAAHSLGTIVACHLAVAAPRLVQTRPDRDQLCDLWQQLVDALSVLARAGLAHGDLSPYNVLVHEGALVLIDLPQVVDVVINPQGPAFLARDVGVMAKWFAARGLETDAGALVADLLSDAGLR